MVAQGQGVPDHQVLRISGAQHFHAFCLGSCWWRVLPVPMARWLVRFPGAGVFSPGAGVFSSHKWNPVGKPCKGFFMKMKQKSQLDLNRARPTSDG